MTDHEKNYNKNTKKINYAALIIFIIAVVIFIIGLVK